MSYLTERGIKESFLRFLNERPLDKISVKYIAEDCRISRKTFYNHFEGIDHLLEVIFREETEKALERDTSASYWLDSFLEMAGFILSNPAALRNIYDSHMHRFVKDYLFRLCARALDRYARLGIGPAPYLEEDLGALTAFYAHGVSGIVSDWVRDGMQWELEPSLRRLGDLLRGSLMDALLHHAPGDTHTK